MKYAALLRGINVGKTKRIDMKQLVALFNNSGFANVSTYINSGNVIFETEKPASKIRKEIESNILEEFGFEVPTLVKSIKEMKQIACIIPIDWLNDENQRTDVAYLFDEIDSAKIIDELPFKREFVDIGYTSGAVYWNVKRVNYNKSHLDKLIGHKLYKYMTIRNVNTARYLAGKE